MIACRFGDFAVFLFGFAKNERDNIEDGELEDLRLIARQWSREPTKIDRDWAAGTLIEVKKNGDQTR